MLIPHETPLIFTDAQRYYYDPEENSISFNAPMVRAVLEGRKSQTRRFINPQPFWDTQYSPNGWWFQPGDGGLSKFPDKETFQKAMANFSPYGQPGDRLWVREVFRPSLSGEFYVYYADEGEDEWARILRKQDPSIIWESSMRMPRDASRITLEIVSIRAERLHDISEEDAIAEGIDADLCAKFTTKAPDRHVLKLAALHAFSGLWESIYGAGAWDDNQWVWVIEFKRVQS